MKGQVLLITVFALTFALFSIFALLAPIKDKLLRIKAMEDVYQAIANSEKGLEASLLDVFANHNLYLNKERFPSFDPFCGGLNSGLASGSCIQIVYTPNHDHPLKLWRNDERFRGNTFIFIKVIDGEGKFLVKSISDGISGKDIRTTFVGPTKR